VTRRPFIVQVVGRSGSGKTLLLASATRALRARGYAVAVLKHSHHVPDLRGKDTDRFRAAGADFVLFSGRRSFVLFRGEALELMRSLPVDVVLVEGYSSRSLGHLRLEPRGVSEVPRLRRGILDRVEQARNRPPTGPAGGPRRSGARRVPKFRRRA
jgi:molybdopterin-guanine dinucleotide biosynthesis adapter protein